LLCHSSCRDVVVLIQIIGRPVENDKRKALWILTSLWIKAVLAIIGLIPDGQRITKLRGREKSSCTYLVEFPVFGSRLRQKIELSGNERRPAPR
jgi:hypothetical protein